MFTPLNTTFTSLFTGVRSFESKLENAVYLYPPQSGTLMHLQEMDICPMTTFLPDVPQWITSGLDTFTFEKGTFVRSRLEKAILAFDLDKN